MPWHAVAGINEGTGLTFRRSMYDRTYNGIYNVLAVPLSCRQDIAEPLLHVPML